MPEPRVKKAEELNGEHVRVDFSPRLRDAFRDLAAALHFSEHVHQDTTLRDLQEWAEGKKPAVADVFRSLPSIAEDVFTHAQKTGDRKALEAWKEISHAFVDENAFTLQNPRVRAR